MAAIQIAATVPCQGGQFYSASNISIDIAKNVFQLCGMNRSGEIVFTKHVGRAKLAESVAHIPPCTVAIEAWTGAYFWHRQSEDMGHAVRIICPQFVKPFVKGQKNDGNDPEAIAVAVQQPTMQFVSPRSIEQQDIQALHRVLQRLFNHRTAKASQIRGLLLERGIPYRYEH